MKLKLRHMPNKDGPGAAARGEVPTLEPVEEAGEMPQELLLATGLDEVVPLPAGGGGDDGFTPESLLGEARDGRWAVREDERDRGLDEPDDPLAP